MELQLRTYSHNGFTIAYNIFQFPNDFSMKFRVLALRYLFQYRTKTLYPPPEEEKLISYGRTQFQKCLENKDQDNMVEIADIFLSNKQEQVGRELLALVDPEIRLDRAERIIERIERKLEGNNRRSRTAPKTVYQDSQNVHNRDINDSVVKASETLFSLYKDQINIFDTERENEEYRDLQLEQICNVLIGTFPNSSDLIIITLDYIKTNIARFGRGTRTISLQEVFLSIWYFINDHEHVTELKQRMIEEFKEMQGYCTTGRLARLISIIQGYTQGHALEEQLSIRISNKEQCFSVVRSYLNKKLQECKDEKVIEGLLDKNDEYKIFIRKCIFDEVVNWRKEYGLEMLKEISICVNKFAECEIFNDAIGGMSELG